jgi:putative nucleotidyltransferase with HDIG domain
MNDAATEAVIADLAEAFHGAGVEAYLVGGFVRDSILGRRSKDIDIVCIGDDGVSALTTFAARRGWSRPAIFERFGTAQTRGDDFIIETVRARREQYDPDSRKPDVAPGTLDEDIMRRDFTVNSLCRTFDGKIIDVTGSGLADLEAGVLRTPLDAAETFSEDPLRMFRAARFVSKLGFTLVDGTIEAMRAVAPRSSVLGRERIRDELNGLLVAAHPRAGMNVLRDGGLLDLIAPELLDMIGIEQGGYHIYDVWDHSMYAVEAAPADLITRCAALFHDVGKPPTHEVREEKHTFYNHPAVGAQISRRIMSDLRYSNHEIDAVAKLVELHLRPIQYDQETWSASAVRRLIRDAGELRPELIELAKADTVASSFPSLDRLEELRLRMDELDRDSSVSKMVSPLSGEQIMRIGDRPPGPWVGKIKAALENAVIEGELQANDGEGAEAWLLAHRNLWSEDATT